MVFHCLPIVMDIQAAEQPEGQEALPGPQHREENFDLCLPLFSAFLRSVQ